MNNRYIDSGVNIKKINIDIFISLLPLIIFGLYKNGIKLYSLGYVNSLGLLKPLLLNLSGFLFGLLASFLYDKLIAKKKVYLIKDAFNSFYPLYGILISCIISINTNYFLFSIITFLVLFFSKFLKKNTLNVVAFIFLILLLIMHTTSNFTFLNFYESSTSLHLEPIDYFLGLGSGGVCTTCTLLLIVSYIILCKNPCYKKEIPIFSIMAYVICIFIYSLFNSNIKLVLESIFSNGLLFNFIYVAPIPMFSSYTNKGKIIYSTLIGIVTFALYLIKPEIASIGAIFILSFSNRLIDKLVER